MGRPFKCPYCEATDNVSKGFRKTKTLGLRALRRCKACGRKFTPRSQQSVPAPGETPPTEHQEPETTDGSAEPMPKEPEHHAPHHPVGL